MKNSKAVKICPTYGLEFIKQRRTLSKFCLNISSNGRYNFQERLEKLRKVSRMFYEHCLKPSFPLSLIVHATKISRDLMVKIYVTFKQCMGDTPMGFYMINGYITVLFCKTTRGK